MSVKTKVSSERVVKKKVSAASEDGSPSLTIVTPKRKRVAKLRRGKKHEKTNPNKLKMARDSFTMPKDEYAQLKVLKTRLAELDRPVKKSELLRAGIKQLALMTDAQLMAAIVALPVIKTGRPKKQDLT